MINHPRILSLVCFLVMLAMAPAGKWLRRRFASPAHDDKNNLTLVVSATLTLLGLIISFTFSMAATRYDQRRLYEEGEANAIGTEFRRADLLPAAEAAAMKAKLRAYLDWRIDFYASDEGTRLTTVDTKTAAWQNQLWQTVQPPASAQPTPVMALVVSGMNDVLNSQGYTQFAWWNRIPTSAWVLMLAVALFANFLVGFAANQAKARNLLLYVLPLIVSLSFFLIADIDSPRGGIILVKPVDLISLSESLHRDQHQP